MSTVNSKKKFHWVVIGGLVMLGTGFAALVYEGITEPVVRGRRKMCISNLRQIAGAKRQWAIENQKPKGSEIVTDEIAKYLKEGKIPQCLDGTYILGRVGELPTCSVTGHSLPIDW